MFHCLSIQPQTAANNTHPFSSAYLSYFSKTSEILCGKIVLWILLLHRRCEEYTEHKPDYCRWSSGVWRSAFKMHQLSSDNYFKLEFISVDDTLIKFVSPFSYWAGSPSIATHHSLEWKKQQKKNRNLYTNLLFYIYMYLCFLNLNLNF